MINPYQKPGRVNTNPKTPFFALFPPFFVGFLERSPVMFRENRPKDQKITEKCMASV